MHTHVALLSAFRKDEALASFARRLVELGWKLLASGGTKTFLDGQGITSTDIAGMVGEPILGHKVVTLSRTIHAALLADLNKIEEIDDLHRLGIEPIDLVCVGLYPIAEEMAKPERTPESVRASIDIGGRALLSAAAKGGRIVVSNPDQFDRVLDVLGIVAKSEPSSIFKFDPRFLADLAAEAERAVSNHGAVAAKAYQLFAEDTFK